MNRMKLKAGYLIAALAFAMSITISTSSALAGPGQGTVCKGCQIVAEK